MSTVDRERWKYAKDLVPGDRVGAGRPLSRAEVTHVRDTGMRLTLERLGPKQEPRPAREIRFILIDGPHKGARDYDALHPEERVRLA